MISVLTAARMSTTFTSASTEVRRIAASTKATGSLDTCSAKELC